MTIKYYARDTKTFDDPSPTQPTGAITTYYKESPGENRILSSVVDGIIDHMEYDLINDPIVTQDLYATELPQHRRKRGGGCYTVTDVIIDLNDQLKTNKDPTESMFNRWNTAFSQIGLDDNCIDVVMGGRPLVNQAPSPRIPNSAFNNLFKEE